LASELHDIEDILAEVQESIRRREKLWFVKKTSTFNSSKPSANRVKIQLRADKQWEPEPGAHCDRSAYARYCPAVQEEPEPLPERDRAPLQLALEFW